MRERERERERERKAYLPCPAVSTNYCSKPLTNNGQLSAQSNTKNSLADDHYGKPFKTNITGANDFLKKQQRPIFL